ncbi:fumarylacetoacetate hydrolase family protein [Siccirubricoccus sp. KC 17139]|uniref:Fumarylacetoacetate hydrolase family protein n=1 Tax=Siccirubricoccus soli TaxID=2899147 RepID=A0ABT1D0D8_9PROT|nr:fumarylacetoacetate hydrolase family protein [Siccirubricoccus soli]MCO6415354.1 fumarylacetoacetate hydrolase family protein [Siccirubricoccus soli]MCP2681486.1 fumarylacetoacetate hydrolase family protein [Siccirubricoccus soli]
MSLAAMLLAARREARQIAVLPPDLVPQDADAAYAVALEVAGALGWAPLGWKIAATTKVMQARLRMAEPIFGRSFARFLVESPARFAHAALLDPIVEAEFFYRLNRDLLPRATPYAEAEIAEAVAVVHAGVEVAECRFPTSALPPPNAVLADGSGNGRYVLGPAIPPGTDLAAMEVVVAVDGVERRRGSGAEVMGHPLRALTWLANRLPRAGTHLRDGEWVSTGTASGMLAARPGQRVTARFGALPEIVIDFA